MMGGSSTDFSVHGIHSIDTGLQRPGFDAAWLIIENGRAAFIDCGTSHAVPIMLDALARHGLMPEAVDWLILTHVHLDHAGGAGALLQHLPNARLIVHPSGAPHMRDPSRLVSGATAVYGQQEMERHYGQVLPVAPERVIEAPDGYAVLLGGRELLCVDTPGHARHHLCVWDGRTRTWFTGDTFGISYRELDGRDGPFIMPTTSPVQFDPVALKQSIALLLGRRPAAMHLTHFATVGTVPEDIERLAARLVTQIDDMVDIASGMRFQSNREDLLFDALNRYMREMAVASGLDPERVLEVLAIDIRLNAQGLVCWLERCVP